MPTTARAQLDRQASVSSNPAPAAAVWSASADASKIYQTNEDLMTARSSEEAEKKTSVFLGA